MSDPRRFTAAAVFLCALTLAVRAAIAPMPECLAPEEARTLAAEATAERYPDADTLDVAGRRYVVYNPDGTYSMWAESYRKVLTPAGARALTAVGSSYREGFSETELQKVEIIRADGTVLTLDPAEAKVVTNNRSVDSNIYDAREKQLMLSLPGLLPGDILHTVIADRYTKVRIPDCYIDVEVFEQTVPIPYADYIVVAPKALPLRSVALLDEVPGTVTQTRQTCADGSTVWKWVARNVPQVFPEENMPDMLSQLQRVQISTFGSWEEVSQWYWALCLPHMEVTDAIRAKINELTDGLTDDEERIRALFRFVSQEIRYMGVIAEDTAPGLEPHDVAMTFDNRYGVCRDKGVLLVAMLREAGFDAYPVIINAGAKIADEVPIPIFNHAVVCIDRGGRDYLMLDPTDETTRDLFPSYLSDCSFLVARPDGDTLRTTPVPPPESGLMEIATVAELSESGSLQIESVMQCGGYNDNIYRSLLIRTPLPQVRRIFDGILKALLPGAEVTAVSFTPEDPQDITKPLVLTLSARVDGYAETDALGRTLVPIPFLSRGFGAANFFLRGLDQPERRFDWVIATPVAVRETLRLRGFGTLGVPALLPDNPSLQAPGAAYGVTVSHGDGGDITLTRRIELSRKTYSPEDYQALRRFVERYSRTESVRPLFTRDPFREADSELLSLSREVTLSGPGTYAVRTRSDRRILTYAGTKRYAEATVTYTPDCETLTLNDIAVTRADGVRQPLDRAREINELDVGHSDTAVRYPGLRSTVMTLPAVGVGAVIHLDYTVESRDRQPFCETYVFGGGDPVRSETYTVRIPTEHADELEIETFHMSGFTYTVTYDDAETVHTWTAKDLPKLPRESALPPLSAFLPTVRVSLRRATPEAVTGVVRRAFEEAVGEADAVRDAVDAAIDAEGDDALRALQAFLEERLRTDGPGWAERPPRAVDSPDTVFADGYGNALDCLAVRAAALDELGIGWQLVFAESASPASRSALAGRIGDSRVWTGWTRPYLMLEDGRLVGEEGRYDEPGACSLRPGTRLLTADGIGAYAPPARLADDAGYASRTIDIDAEGNATVTARSRLRGLSAGALRRAEAERKPEEHRRYLAGMAAGIMTGAEPIAYAADTEAYPVTTEFSVRVRNYANAADGVFSAVLPLQPSSAYGVRGSQRIYPLWFGGEGESRTDVTVILPPGAEIRMMPEPYALDLPGGGRVTLTRTVSQTADGRTALAYTLTQEVKPAFLDAYAFPALADLNRRLRTAIGSTLLFALPGQADAEPPAAAESAGKGTGDAADEGSGAPEPGPAAVPETLFPTLTPAAEAA